MFGGQSHAACLAGEPTRAQKEEGEQGLAAYTKQDYRSGGGTAASLCGGAGRGGALPSVAAEQLPRPALQPNRLVFCGEEGEEVEREEGEEGWE